MGDDKATKGLDNKGQQKTHEVFDADGNRIEMTQAEWRNRDKSVGYTRPDDDVDVAEPTEPVEGEGGEATDGGTTEG